MQPTRITPTSLGLGVSPAASLASSLPVAAVTATPAAPATTPLVLPEKFPVNLDATQTAKILERVENFDLMTQPAEDIATLGSEPTADLNHALGVALDRISNSENPQLFKLVDKLQEEIAKERIGELAEQMLSAQPSMGDRILGVFSKKALQRGLDRAYEELGRAARAKSKTLSDVVEGMERKLQVEMTKVHDELRHMAAVKGEYRNAFFGFAEEVAFLSTVLAKSQAQAPALLKAAGQDVTLQQDIQDKLQLLESVALSRETMMTRMPAEALIIRQLENAGISTLQELSVTMGDRFASIRMTLLGIHGANAVRNLQRLGQSGADLDSHLQEARAKLMGTVVTTAAHAPGKNRLEQANNLKRVVTDTQNLQAIVETAREENRAKSAEARAILSQARQDIQSLGQRIPSARRIGA